MCKFYGGLFKLSQCERAFYTRHCLQVQEQFLAIGNHGSSSITNTADPSLAWIGRRKSLLAYTLIFAVGAVRYSRFVPPLLNLC
jgi:hypothetical protein